MPVTLVVPPPGHETLHCSPGGQATPPPLLLPPDEPLLLLPKVPPLLPLPPLPPLLLAPPSLFAKPFVGFVPPHPCVNPAPTIEKNPRAAMAVDQR